MLRRRQKKTKNKGKTRDDEEDGFMSRIFKHFPTLFTKVESSSTSISATPTISNERSNMQRTHKNKKIQRSKHTYRVKKQIQLKARSSTGLLDQSKSSSTSIEAKGNGLIQESSTSSSLSVLSSSTIFKAPFRDLSLSKSSSIFKSICPVASDTTIYPCESHRTRSLHTTSSGSTSSLERFTNCRWVNRSRLEFDLERPTLRYKNAEWIARWKDRLVGNDGKVASGEDENGIQYDAIMIRNYAKRYQVTLKSLQRSRNKINQRTLPKLKMITSKLSSNINNKKSRSKLTKVIKQARMSSRFSIDSQKTVYLIHKSMAHQAEQIRGKSGSKVLRGSASQLEVGGSSNSSEVVTPFEILIRGYLFHREIQRGAFSIVYEASMINSLTNLKLACKHIKTEELLKGRSFLRDFLHEEVKILKIVAEDGHPNIVEVRDIIDTESNLFIFMRYATEGTIFDYLYKYWRKPLPESYAKQWTTQLLSAVKYLHNRRIAHRDLKLENYLLDERLTALLSDFGMSLCLDSPNATELLAVHCGTSDYMAPEVHMASNCANGFYDPLAADIYSLGVCLFEMVNFYRPFAISFTDTPQSLILRQTHRQYEHNRSAGLSPSCCNLIHQMLEPKPNNRPNATSLLCHPWFTTNTN